MKAKETASGLQNQNIQFLQIYFAMQPILVFLNIEYFFLYSYRLIFRIDFMSYFPRENYIYQHDNFNQKICSHSVQMRTQSNVGTFTY